VGERRLGRSLCVGERCRDDVSDWLAALPPDVKLWEVDENVADHVAGLADRFPEVAISLLSKVLHRKRPHLVPLLDRHVVDWYRPITRRRAMADAWPAIVQAMRDEQKNPEWRFVTAMALQPIEQDLQQAAGPDDCPRLSLLRAVDIAIWMASGPTPQNTGDD
jgi:hypothetical protein